MARRDHHCTVAQAVDAGRRRATGGAPEIQLFAPCDRRHATAAMEGVRNLSHAAAGVAAVAFRKLVSECVPWIRHCNKKRKKKELCPVGDSNSGFLGHNEGY